MHLRNLLLFSFVLLIIPLFGNSAINVLESGISWVDKKVFNRTIENFELNKTNQDVVLSTISAYIPRSKPPQNVESRIILGKIANNAPDPPVGQPAALGFQNAIFTMNVNLYY